MSGGVRKAANGRWPVPLQDGAAALRREFVDDTVTPGLRRREGFELVALEDRRGKWRLKR